jgi:gentisate 1,2-dioxygenase
MVLTPNDTWHNHGTVGNEQALNLSVLDLPLVETLNAIHFDHDYKEEENGKLVSRKSRPRVLPATTHRPLTAMAACCRVSPAPNRAVPAIRRRCSSIAGKWCANCLRSIRTAMGDAHDGLLVEYIDPTTGQPVFKTITFFAQMLQPGQKTLPVRTTANLLVSPFEGTGYSVVDGKRYDWKEFDTLAIPGGSWFEHHNGSAKEPLFLFVASDEPTLKKLDLYKKVGQGRCRRGRPH